MNESLRTASQIDIRKSLFQRKAAHLQTEMWLVSNL